jgi:hypothetical protein
MLEGNNVTSPNLKKRKARTPVVDTLQKKTRERKRVLISPA